MWIKAKSNRTQVHLPSDYLIYNIWHRIYKELKDEIFSLLYIEREKEKMVIYYGRVCNLGVLFFCLYHCINLIVLFI